MTLFVSILSIICSGCVIVMARVNMRLVRENRQLIETLNSLFIEAVWPPHEPNVEES
jgi:hypothetical protein